MTTLHRRAVLLAGVLALGALALALPLPHSMPGAPPLFGGIGPDAAQEPNVIAEGGTLKMWYTAGLVPPVMAYATSRDGVHWHRYGAIYGGGAGGYAGRYEHASVARLGGQYVTYFADNNNGTLWRATSADGLRWSAPRLVLAQAAVPWSLGWNNSYVWRERAGWRMLVEGARPDGLFSLTLALSPDGLHWRFPRAGYLESLRPTGTGTTGGPDMLTPQRQHGVYTLYYHASTDGSDLPTDIYRATSPDLLHWTIQNGGRPALARARWFEVDQVADPALVRFGGHTSVYYEGVDNPHSAFRMAMAPLP